MPFGLFVCACVKLSHGRLRDLLGMACESERTFIDRYIGRLDSWREGVQ
jgi:hypothetical protein